MEKYKYRIKIGCIELQIEGTTNNRNSERKGQKTLQLDKESLLVEDKIN